MEAIQVTTTTYPVRVDAQLDTPLNRGLWLVKWAAVIPHYLVLAVLWLTFVVLSAVALAAILVTGRYPRSIFDFNVGVLRWSWRVAYYAYGALGTDRYPPFTLKEVPDYPATLDIDYPEHLSRGLALVKWWLLAVPHYLVVGIFLGGGLYVANEAVASDHAPWLWGSGLIGLLVLVAGVVLLVTGRYPRDVFDLVLGMNRWVLRVAAYAGLMTDEYPPFRLDQGGQDPGTTQLVAAAPRPPDDGPPPAPDQHGSTSWSAGRTAGVVTSSLLLLLSAGLVSAGVAAAVADRAMRDDAGFVTSGSETFSTATYAVTTENLELHVADGAAWVPESLLGEVRVTATAPAGADAFLGVAATSRVDAYLTRVPHAVFVDRTDGTPVYRDDPGVEAPAAPTDQDLWVAQAAGPGEQSITWMPEDGDWTLVLMDPDGSPGVSADVTVGAELPALGAAAAALLLTGGTLLVVAIVLLAATLLAARRASPGGS